MSAARFTVRLGNVYYANRRLTTTIRKLLTGRPDVIAVNEGKHASRRPVRALMRAAGYRQHIAPAGQEKGRTDVLAYVHKRNRYLGALSLVIAKPLPGFPASHERQLLAVLLDTAVGRVAVLVLHPSPGPEALIGTDPTHPLVNSYGVAMARTEDTIVYLEELGYRVVVAGDVQLRDSAPRRPWNPYVMLERAGLDVTVSAGLDVIAANPRLEPVDARVLARAGTAGDHDHDLLTATYRRKGNR